MVFKGSKQGFCVATHLDQLARVCYDELSHPTVLTSVLPSLSLLACQSV